MATDMPDVAAPTAAAPEPAETEAFDLSFLEEGDEDVAQTPTETPAEVPAEVPPEEEVKEEEAPKKEPEKKEEEKPKEELTPDQRAEQLRLQKEAFIAELSMNYEQAVTPEEKETIGEDTAKVMARMAAKLHAEVYESSIRALFTQLPVAVLAFEAQRSQHTSAESQFDERWPELKDRKEAVGRIAKVYRQTNPSATTEQAIADIGAISMQTLGLSTTGTAKPNGHAKVQKKAAPPAPAGVGKTAPSAPKEKNVFEELLLWEEGDS
jgi:hypothetical protein